jgi:hypothetical protein
VTEPVAIDPYEAVRSAPVHVETIPGETHEPPWTPETDGAAPVVTPPRVQLTPDLTALPSFLKSPDGTILDHGAAIAVLWQLLHSMEIRSVSGSYTLTTAPEFTGGSVWPAGLEIERPVTWLDPAPRVPTGVLVRAEAGVLGAGKTVGTPVVGTISTTGATLRLRNVSGGQVVVTAQAPITYIAQALYLHTPTITS